ncbi:MAG: sigma-54 dependent transcriptional regulator [Candidatus Korobacteraceae bacterium]|jgi:two-component system response regulator AtoC
MAYSILVIDDEALTLRTIGRALQGDGYEVRVAMSGEEGLKLFQEEATELALVDVVLPGIDGIEVLRQIKKRNSAAVVLMMSAYHMVDRAVESMKLGAYDYLIKPFHIVDMLNTVRRASEMLTLHVRVRDSVQTEQGRYDFGKVVTRNPGYREMLEMARKAAESDRTTVLIQGESGTGKEVLAKAIHYASPRAQNPLVDINCAALPDTLLESELFGYEQGAFTDARRRKEGLLEKADGGTLFLDEIGNMSVTVQAKLLRVLEQSSFLRLGGTKPINVDVRMISATNKNLKEAVLRGEFREDLFYRLNVMPLYIPALRDRREDVVPLALEMMKKYNTELKRNFAGYTPAAAELLTQYPWPGNIRELKNVIERTMILTPEGEIDAISLPEEIRDYQFQHAVSPTLTNSAAGPEGKFVSLRELEQRYIHEVLAATGNNKAQTARILGIHSTSLLRKLKKEDGE